MFVRNLFGLLLFTYVCAHNCNRERTTSTTVRSVQDEPQPSSTTTTTTTVRSIQDEPKPSSTTTRRPSQIPSRRVTTAAPREIEGDESQPPVTKDWGHNKNLVCYYGSWAVYRPGKGKYPVENIDPFLCTHIIYSFAGLGHDNRIRALDPWNDLRDNYGKGAFERFTGLKRQNPKLKALIAIGGWNEGSIKYSNMAQSESARKVFIDSVVEFLAKYDFDGLDLDWEYPAARGGKPEDKNSFSLLIRELKAAFEPKGYLLTAAVSAGKWFIDPAYHVPDLGRYLDLINVMAYDYHGGWEDKTGHNAPMFARPDELGNDRISNVNYSINYWIAQGASREKIMLGMGTYGRSFTLQRESDNGYGAPAPQKGQAGPYTREPGSLGYNEFCEQQASQKWTVVRDPYGLAPYAYSGRQWVGYDDKESIAIKTRFANALGLGGAMIWSLETDDFLGECHGETYPLLKTINRVLAEKNSEVPTPMPDPVTEDPDESEDGGEEGESSSERSSTASWDRSQTSSTTTSTTTWPSWSSSTSSWEREFTSSTTSRPSRPSSTTAARRTPSTSTTKTSTTSTTSFPNRPDTGIGSSLPCKEAGMNRHPKDCKKFYRCVDSGVQGRYMVYEYDCPNDTVFDTNTNLCLWPQSVPECSNYYINSDQPNEVFGMRFYRPRI